jgi:type IV secretory pathway VirB9-like protein
VIALSLPEEPAPLPVPDHDGLEGLPVIERANQRALIRPTAADFRRAEVIFPYRRGALYRIDTAVQQPTDVVLSPGERLLKYVSGEKRWLKDISEGIDPVHILLMPTRPKLRTRITLVTTKATYYLAIYSHHSTGLAAVSWRHPAPPVPQAAGHYGIGYGVSAVEGLSWAPRYAWDYAGRTYLLMDARVAQTAVPSVSVVRGETASLVNVRVQQQGRLYVIDRLLDAGERLELQVTGRDAPVQVARTPEARQIQCPGEEACRVVMRWTPAAKEAPDAAE